MYTYPIDYDLYTTEEIIIIVDFLSWIEEASKRKVDPIILSKKHVDYRKVINSIAMEKQIDRDFEKASGISIYKTLKKYKRQA